MNNSKSKKLTQEEIENFGKELESIRSEILSKVGEEDSNYIKNLDKTIRYYEITGRLILHFSLDPVTWGIGTGLLSISKILNNMELGHNVLHGQYDWMNDPYLHSKKFEWDNVSESSQWQYSHNYMHHTYTNVLGKDHDFGYNLLRMSEDQKWNPLHLFQIIINIFLSLTFQFGIARHGVIVKFMELPEKDQTKENYKELQKKYHSYRNKLMLRDYVLFPLLSGLGAPKVFFGNLIANTIRNVWAHSIIFCGHFTEDVETFKPEEMENEGKGGFYLRQLKGSSNLKGSELFYLLSGHLSHQIEHHMFPDLPANRYEEIAPRVQEICKKYQQNYNTGDFFTQFKSVWKRIWVHSFPNSLKTA
jgi:NADPH-dependent stearoyl-CoA 9-desaturase